MIIYLKELYHDVNVSFFFSFTIIIKIKIKKNHKNKKLFKTCMKKSVFVDYIIKSYKNTRKRRQISVKKILSVVELSNDKSFSVGTSRVYVYTKTQINTLEIYSNILSYVVRYAFEYTIYTYLHSWVWYLIIVVSKIYIYAYVFFCYDPWKHWIVLSTNPFVLVSIIIFFIFHILLLYSPSYD